jgi:hypothetical protein
VSKRVFKEGDFASCVKNSMSFVLCLGFYIGKVCSC